MDQLDGHSKDARKCMEMTSFFVVNTLWLWYVVVVKKCDPHEEISVTCSFGDFVSLEGMNPFFKLFFLNRDLLNSCTNSLADW